MQILRMPVSLKKFLLLAGVSAVLWSSAAHATAVPGDLLVRRNASDATTNLPDGGVNVNLGWDTQVAATGTSVTYSGGTFTLDAGKYIVMYNEYFQSEEDKNNARIEIQGRLVIDGSTVMEGAAQGYMISRPKDTVLDTIVSGAAIIDIPTDGTSLKTLFYRTDDSVDDTTVRNAGRGGVTILALDDTAWYYARYATYSTATMPDGFADMDWQSTQEEDAGFSRSWGEVTVSAAGRYLVSYTIPISDNGSGSQMEHVGRLTADDVEIEGARVSTYSLGVNSTVDGVLRYIGVVDLDAGDVLAVEVDRTDGAAADAVAGSNLQILMLPDATETFIVTGSGGTNDLDPSTEQEFAFDTVAQMDVASFTSVNTRTVEVDVADDYMFFASAAVEDGSSTRAYPIGRFSINDAPVGYGAAGQPNRNQQGADNAGYAFGALLPGLSIGDDISLEVQGVGQNTGALDSDHSAMSGFVVSSLFASGPVVPPYDVLFEFDPESGAGDGWIFEAPSGNGLQASDSRAYWSWDSDETASGTVGPLSGQGGTGEGYVYTEATSPGTFNDVYTMTMENGANGELYELYLDFYISADNNNQPVTIEAQAWDGTQWNTLLNRGGGDDPAWINYNYDLSAYENTDVKVRFVVTFGATGTIWNNDIGIDTVRMYGFPRIIYGGKMTLHDVPFDNQKTPKTTPDFEMTGNDPDGSADLRYHLQIATDPTFVSPQLDCESSGCTTGAGTFLNIDNGSDTSPFDDNSRIRFTPTTALVDGSTYWWRVRTLDETASGGTGVFGNWTEPMSFTVDTTLNASEWFQTTDEQFYTGTLQTAQTTGSGQVGLIGGVQTEYELLTSYPEAGWGNGQNNPGDPFNTLYEDSRVQALYLASDLLAAGISSGTDIIGVELKGHETPGRDISDFRIRMKQTTATTMTDWEGGWAETFGPTDILTTDIAKGFWNPFTLPNGITWDGTSNLMVDLSRDDNSWAANGGIYVRTGVGTDRAFSGYCDSCGPAELYARDKDRPNDTTTLQNFLPSIALVAQGSGSIMSSPITYSKFDGAPISWGQASWSETETTGTVSLRVFYSTANACDTLVPDSALSGNFNGFPTSPLDLSGLDTTTYGEICLHAQLTDGSPTLNEWGVSVQYLEMTQTSFAWYEDNNALTPTTRWGITTENAPIMWFPLMTANPPIAEDELRLRMGVMVGGTTPMPAGSANFKLQFQKTSTGACTGGTWTNVESSAAWEFADSGVVDGTTLSSTLLTGTDVVGVYSKSLTTSDTTSSAAIGDQVEFDFHLIGTNTVSAAQYAFRMVFADENTFVGGYTNCPVVSMMPDVDDFLRHGNIFTSDGVEQGFFWANN